MAARALRAIHHAATLTRSSFRRDCFCALLAALAAGRTLNERRGGREAKHRTSSTADVINPRSAAKPWAEAVFTLRHRLLPLMTLGIALIANAIWIGFLGYWLGFLECWLVTLF